MESKETSVQIFLNIPHKKTHLGLVLAFKPQLLAFLGAWLSMEVKCIG